MKKLLSLVLVLCMLASMSITAFATDDGTTPPDVPVVTPEIIPEDTPAKDLIVVMTPNESGVSAKAETLKEAIEITSEEPIDNVNYIGAIDTDGATVDLHGAVISDPTHICLNGNSVAITQDAVGSSGTETLGMQLLESSDKVYIEGQGGTIKFNGTLGGQIAANKDLKFGIQNYSDLTLDNVNVNGQDLADYGAPNYVVSNNSGSLTVTNNASIIAEEGDVAFDVYVYEPYYKDAPDVRITSTAGTIEGTIEFDGSNACKDMTEEQKQAMQDEGRAPSLTIEGGTFNNFLLKIGDAVASFIENITISGGNYDTIDVVDSNGSKDTYSFNQFVEDGFEVVQKEDGRYYVQAIVQVTPDAPPVEVYIPVEPEYVPAPAPAPKPAAPAPVVVAPAAPVAVEVNGATVELTVVAEDIKAEAVAPVKEGKAAELKVTVAPTVLAVEGAEAEEVVEALVATATVSVKEGETLAAENYQITMDANGELKVELSAEYLKTLGAGEHIIVLNIGGIEIEFTIIIK